MAVTDRPAMDDSDGFESSPAIDSLDIENKKFYSPRQAPEWTAMRNFINAHCIARCPAGSKELPSINRGEFYTWQFYLRASTLIPDFLEFLAASFWHSFAARYQRAPFQLAGLECASVPILTAITMAAPAFGAPDIHAFTIRKEYKAYGKGNIIEGLVINRPVVIIDDLTSQTHNSLWHVVRILRRGNLTIYPYCWVLVRKQRAEESPIINTASGPLTIESLFTLDDFDLAYRAPVELAGDR